MTPRFTRQEGAKLLKKAGVDPATVIPQRKNKYNAVSVKNEHGHFDSKAEFRRYMELRNLERAGVITDLRHHEVFDLVVNGVPITRYEADFVYQQDGEEVVEDVKGGTATMTAAFRMKARLMEALHGKKIEVIHV